MENLNSISFEAMKTFIRVVDSGGFHAAAEQLYMTEPAVSARIKGLENVVGCKLLERGRVSRLTESGQYFYHYAKQTLEHYNSMISHLRNLNSGREGQLKVAALRYLPMTLLSNACLSVSEKSPNAMIRLSSMSLKYVYESVENETSDIGLVYRNAMWHPMVSDQSVGNCKTIFVARSGHPLTLLHPARLEDMLQYNLFFPSAVSEYSGISSSVAELVCRRPPIVIDDFESAREFVARTDYVLLSPEIMLRDSIEAGRLSKIDAEFKTNDLKICLVTKKSRISTPLQTLFLNELRNAINQAPKTTATPESGEQT